MAVRRLKTAQGNWTPDLHYSSLVESILIYSPLFLGTQFVSLRYGQS